MRRLTILKQLDNQLVFVECRQRPRLFLSPPSPHLLHACLCRESSGRRCRGGAEGRRLLHRTGRHRQRRLGAHDARGTAGAHLRCCSEREAERNQPGVQFLSGRTSGYISGVLTQQGQSGTFTMGRHGRYVAAAQLHNVRCDAAN